MTSVLLKEYDPLWVSQFEADRTLISRALGGLAKRIEHVGSTSIPGMKAKPIIDIAVAVEGFLALDDKISKLEEIGYEYVPKIEFPNHRFFGVDNGGQELTTCIYMKAKACDNERKPS